MHYSLCFSPPAEADHRGPAEFQRGEIPAFSWGASGEHHKWRRPHGRFVLYAWRPARANRGWMQLCAAGAAGSALWVHGQCRCTLNTVFPSRLLLFSPFCSPKSLNDDNKYPPATRDRRSPAGKERGVLFQGQCTHHVCRAVLYKDLQSQHNLSCVVWLLKRGVQYTQAPCCALNCLTAVVFR